MTAILGSALDMTDIYDRCGYCAGSGHADPDASAIDPPPDCCPVCAGSGWSRLCPTCLGSGDRDVSGPPCDTCDGIGEVA